MCPHSVLCTGKLKFAEREKQGLRQTEDRGTLIHSKEEKRKITDHRWGGLIPPFSTNHEIP